MKLALIFVVGVAAFAAVSCLDASDFFAPMVGVSPKSLKRQSQSTCFNVTCLPRNAQCSGPDPCQACADEFNVCVQGPDPSKICDCFKNVSSCFTKVGSCAAYAASYSQACETTLGSSCQCPTSQPVDVLDVKLCEFTDYCDIKNQTTREGFCSPKKKTGTCADDDECGDPEAAIFGSVYSCDASTCTYVSGQAQVGDACTKATDCVSDTCTNGVCVGIKIGDICSFDNECEFGAWCHMGVCTAELALGADCTYDADSTDPCGSGRICSSAGKCIAMFSVANGQSCDVAVECQLGSYCKDGTCAALPTTIPTCTADSDCTQYGMNSTCDCGLNGKRACTIENANDFPAACASSATDMFTCLRAAKCKSDAPNPAPGSCAIKNCEKEVNCALSCYMQGQQIGQLINAGCLTVSSTWTCGSASGASTAASSGVTGTVTGNQGSDSVVVSVSMLVVVCASILATLF